MEKRDNNIKPKKKIRTSIKILLGILITILVIVLGIGFYANSLLGKVEKEELSKDDLGITDEIEKSISEYDNNKEVKNIALFGVDTVEGETGRSDSIMVLTVDKVHNKVKLSSIMRDSYVNIPGRGFDKINHAYAFGGPQLSISTINSNFKLNIDSFVSVNFSSLPKVIDKLGGIELNITNEEISFINRYIKQVNKLDNANCQPLTSGGVQTVNGYQALAYSRIRKDGGGDQKRTSRQREVLSGMLKKMKTIPITSYPSLLDEILPLVKTSLSSSELISLAKNTSTMTIEQRMFPEEGKGKNSMINGVYYMTYDLEEASKSMKNYIFEDK